MAGGGYLTAYRSTRAAEQAGAGFQGRRPSGAPRNIVPRFMDTREAVPNIPPIPAPRPVQSIVPNVFGSGARRLAASLFQPPQLRAALGAVRLWESLSLPRGSLHFNTQGWIEDGCGCLFAGYGQDHWKPGVGCASTYCVNGVPASGTLGISDGVTTRFSVSCWWQDPSLGTGGSAQAIYRNTGGYSRGPDLPLNPAPVALPAHSLFPGQPGRGRPADAAPEPARGSVTWDPLRLMTDLAQADGAFAGPPRWGAVDVGSGEPVEPSRRGLNPARPKGKQTKFKGAGAAARFAAVIGFNAATEGRDAVKALWQNIPPDQRMFYGSPTLARMALDVWLNWNKVQFGPWKYIALNGKVSDHKGAFWDLASNAIQDAFFGGLGMAAARGARATGMSTSPARGTAAMAGYGGYSERGGHDPVTRLTDAAFSGTRSDVTTVRQSSRGRRPGRLFPRL